MRSAHARARTLRFALVDSCIQGLRRASRPQPLEARASGQRLCAAHPTGERVSPLLTNALRRRRTARSRCSSSRPDNTSAEARSGGRIPPTVRRVFDAWRSDGAGLGRSGLGLAIAAASSKRRVDGSGPRTRPTAARAYAALGLAKPGPARPVSRAGLEQAPPRSAVSTSRSTAEHAHEVVLEQPRGNGSPAGRTVQARAS
jgi:hypothetical protein